MICRLKTKDFSGFGISLPSSVYVSLVRAQGTPFVIASVLVSSQ